MKIKRLPDWSGSCLIKIRPGPGRSGCCREQNQAAAWLIRQLPNWKQAAAWLIRTPVCEKSRIVSVLKILNERVTYSVNQWINYKGVCSTAPATPGLLNIINYVLLLQLWVLFSEAVSEQKVGWILPRNWLAANSGQRDNVPFSRIQQDDFPALADTSTTADCSSGLRDEPQPDLRPCQQLRHQPRHGGWEVSLAAGGGEGWDGGDSGEGGDGDDGGGDVGDGGGCLTISQAFYFSSSFQSPSLSLRLNEIQGWT